MSGLVPGATPLAVVVTGGRDYADAKRLGAALDDAHAGGCIRVVYHGACGVRGCKGWKTDGWRQQLRGADRLAEEWANRNRVPTIAFPAFWNDLGTAAGPIRNGWMLGAAKTAAAITGADVMLLAFPGRDGTADCVAQAWRYKVDIVVDLRDEVR